MGCCSGTFPIGTLAGVHISFSAWKAFRAAFTPVSFTPKHAPSPVAGLCVRSSQVEKGGRARKAIGFMPLPMKRRLCWYLDAEITWLKAVSWLPSVERFGCGLILHRHLTHTVDAYEGKGKQTARCLYEKIELNGFQVLNRYGTDARRSFGGRRARIEALARAQSRMGAKTIESCWHRRYRIMFISWSSDESLPDEQQISRLERRREPISLLQKAFRGYFRRRLSLLSMHTRPVAGLCVRHFVVEYSGREEERRARAPVGFMPVLMDGMSVVLVRDLNADVKRPKGTCPESLVVERIGFVC